MQSMGQKLILGHCGWKPCLSALPPSSALLALSQLLWAPQSRLTSLLRDPTFHETCRLPLGPCSPSSKPGHGLHSGSRASPQCVCLLSPPLRTKCRTPEHNLVPCSQQALNACAGQSPLLGQPVRLNWMHIEAAEASVHLTQCPILKVKIWGPKRHQLGGAHTEVLTEVKRVVSGLSRILAMALHPSSNLLPLSSSHPHPQTCGGCSTA